MWKELRLLLRCCSICDAGHETWCLRVCVLLFFILLTMNMRRMRRGKHKTHQTFDKHTLMPSEWFNMMNWRIVLMAFIWLVIVTKLYTTRQTNPFASDWELTSRLWTFFRILMELQQKHQNWLSYLVSTRGETKLPCVYIISQQFTCIFSFFHLSQQLKNWALFMLSPFGGLTHVRERINDVLLSLFCLLTAACSSFFFAREDERVVRDEKVSLSILLRW